MGIKVYIIGTIVRGKEILGYNLIDIRDNFKTMIVKRDSLISTVLSGQIEIENAIVISGQNVTSIRGKTYSLECLNCEDKKTGKFYNKGILMLTPDIGVVATLVGANVKKMSNSDIINALKNGCIINKDEAQKWITERDNNKLRALPMQNIVGTDEISPEAEIDIPTFEKFMKKHNWSYTIEQDPIVLGDTIYTLTNVSPECTILHIPVGITVLDNVFSSEPKNLIQLVISKTVTKIGNLFPNQQLKKENTTVKDIYIQEREFSIVVEGCGLSSLDITGQVRLPNKPFSRLERAFNDCKINYINFDEAKIRRVSNSFNKTKFNCTNPIKMCQLSIVDSYVETSGICAVEFCGKSVDIEKSFVYSSIKKISAEDIKSIERSFCQCALTDVDLSKCEHLFNMSFSFIQNKNLKSVGMYSLYNGTVINFSATDRMQENNFRDCPVEKLYIANNFVDSNMHIFGIGSETEVILGKEFKKLGRFDFVKKNGDEKITIDPMADELRLINADSITYANGVYKVGEIDMAEKVTSVSKDAFKMYKQQVVDTMELPNWDTIETFTFRDSFISTLIINTNIRTIHDGALDGMFQIRNLIIDDTNIENELKKTMFKQKQMIRVFVIHGSKAAKQFARWGASFAVTEVDSIDEAKKLIFTDVGKDNVSKYKLLLTGTEHEWLASDKYENNISFLYKCIAESKNNITEPELDLDTSKLREVTCPSSESFIKICMNKCKDLLDMPDEPTYKHNNRFVSMCNLITNLFENVESAYSETFWKNIHDKVTVTDIMTTVIYGDEKNDIIMQVEYDISMQVELGIYSKVTSYLLLVLVRGKIQFISNVDLIGYFDYSFQTRDDRTLSISQTSKYTDSIVNYSITKHLKHGDCILPNGQDRHCIINGVEIPFKGIFRNKANPWKIIGDTWILIGYVDKDSKSISKTVKSVYYDILTQKFITTIIENNNVDIKTGIASRYESFRVGYINQIYIDNIYDLSELDTIGYEYFKALSRFCYYEPNSRVINLLALSDTEINNIRSDAKNYDVGNNQAICQTADAIYSCLKNRQDKKFPISKSDLDTLMQGKLFKETQLKLRDIMKADSSYVKKQNYTLEGYKNDSTKYIEFEPGRYSISNLSIFGTVTKQGGNRFKTELYKCITSLQRIVDVLYIVGEFRANNKVTNIRDRVVNEPVNLDEFAVINNQFVTVSRSESDALGDNNGPTRYEVRIAIEKAGGNIFIIVGEADRTVGYTLFRMKDLYGAYDIMQRVMGRSTMTINLIEVLKEIQYKKESNGSLLSILRNSIINGAPNNMYIPGVTDTETGYKLMEQMAKQQEG